MQVARIERPGWPDGTYEIVHNGVTLYVIPVVDGIEIDTDHSFHVAWDNTNEFHELTFFEFPEPKIE